MLKEAMQRDTQKMATEEFDVAIIGGGIYGAWAAWDAALRGLKVALFEQNDFGGATSSNSLKIIHGGLRYLQHADFKRMRESINERKTLMSIAPQFVHTMPCVMPTYGHGLKGKELLSIALKINDLVGFDRNSLPDKQKHMPAGKSLSKKEIISILPGINEKGLTGGALWYDCQVHNSERLLLSVLHGAVGRGAQIANYAQVVAFEKKDDSIIGLRIKDKLSGETLKIKSKIVLNTSGPWINNLLGTLNGHSPAEEYHFSKAINLVIRRQLIPKFAAGVMSKIETNDTDALLKSGGQTLFFTPWRKYSLIGTTHWPYSGETDDFSITEEDIQTFLDEFNSAYPALNVTREDISHCYGGLLPSDQAPSSSCAHVNIRKHYELLDHQKTAGLSGLVSVLGVKYTTARDVSAKALDMVCRKLGSDTKSNTHKQPIWGGDIKNFNHFQEEIANEFGQILPKLNLIHLIYNYGARCRDIFQFAATNPEWLQPVCADQDVLKVEIYYGIRCEMATQLTDILLRRTELGSAGCPDDDCIAQCAKIMAQELGWDENERQQQINAAIEFYKPVSS